MPMTSKALLKTAACALFFLSSYFVFAQNGQEINKSVPAKHISETATTKNADPKSAVPGSQGKSALSAPIQQKSGSSVQTSVETHEKKNVWQWLKDNGYDLPLTILVSIIIGLASIIIGWWLAKRNKSWPYKWEKKWWKK